MRDPDPARADRPIALLGAGAAGTCLTDIDGSGVIDAGEIAALLDGKGDCG